MNEELKKHIKEVCEEADNDPGFQKYMAEKRELARRRDQMAQGDKKRYIFDIYLPVKVTKDRWLAKMLKERSVGHHYFKADKLFRIECSLQEDVDFFDSYFVCLRNAYKRYWVGGRYYNGEYFKRNSYTKYNNFYSPLYDPTDPHYNPEFVRKCQLMEELKKQGRFFEAQLVNLGIL